MDDGPPPPPPPHGQNPRPPGGLPDGNYDIFIIPPHSAGSGFLYLPSLQPHRNSFIAGIFVALASVGIYIAVMPVLRAWIASIMGGNGAGVLILVALVGLGAWAIGKTTAENTTGAGAGTGTGAGAGAGADRQQYRSNGPQSHSYTPPPPPPPHNEAPPQQEEPPPKPKPSAAQSGWEKAREETRRREEERKRAEELKRKREAAQKMRDEAEAQAKKAREEAERNAKAKAEKEKWEQARAREMEQRERDARERIAREKEAREKEAKDKEAKEQEAKAAKATADKEAADRIKAARERLEKMRLEREQKRAASATSAPSPTKNYVQPTARSAVGTEDGYSFRPYDTQSSPAGRARTAYKSSASSVSGLSESSYAPSMSTARTTPPPSQRGPYSTNDINKIQIRAVYLFSDSFPGKPVAHLVAGEGSVTDGLILKIQTAGLFIDDDLRHVAQREWDVKAWTLKTVEDGGLKGKGLHVFRATVRDGENKKYTFVMDEKEAHKVTEGLKNLKKGSQVRSLDNKSMKEAEVTKVLSGLGWI
ncbi:hypothetical protein WHR41_00314 [Cladosporium halotolerans]|uniref:Uncharacterized protein n=1 Tax=Cladosporium halotolerans TaxID=1052096 RepID=A0AB34L0T9_9PEZI